jgi:hypothetical protein
MAIRTTLVIASAVLVLLAAAVAQDRPPSVRDIDGRVHRPFDARQTSVLFFVLPECPIANKLAPEMNRIALDYEKKGVRFYLVHAEPTVTVDEARRHAAEFSHKIPVLLDPRHRLAKATGAQKTPEAVVLRNGELVYRGRINDLYRDLGRRRLEVEKHDLREALDLVLAGKPVPKPWPEAVGCVIQLRSR